MTSCTQVGIVESAYHGHMRNRRHNVPSASPQPLACLPMDIPTLIKQSTFVGITDQWARCAQGSHVQGSHDVQCARLSPLARLGKAQLRLLRC